MAIVPDKPVTGNTRIIDEKASQFLGKQTHNYNLDYSIDLLVNIERRHNREDHNIGNLDGFDIWHNYEVSFLLNNGYPLTFVAKIKIPSSSKYFIESKSMKLYFFSFNMLKLGDTEEEAVQKFLYIVKNDLSKKTESYVEIELFNDIKGIYPFEDFFDLKILSNDTDFSNFKESPNLLELAGKQSHCKFKFTGFRSNCRVTHQPDFSNIFLEIKGNVPTLISLLKYLVSFRNEFHFHEEVTEQIFQAIMDKINPHSLVVYNLFTRRGGLDICPVRYTENAELVKDFGNVKKLTQATIYQ